MYINSEISSWSCSVDLRRSLSLNAHQPSPSKSNCWGLLAANLLSLWLNKYYRIAKLWFWHATCNSHYNYWTILVLRLFCNIVCYYDASDSIHILRGKFLDCFETVIIKPELDKHVSTEVLCSGQTITINSDGHFKYVLVWERANCQLW